MNSSKPNNRIMTIIRNAEESSLQKILGMNKGLQMSKITIENDNSDIEDFLG